ncbi:MAG: nucleoside-diphosphate kinase [Clostridium sp.]
MEKSLVLIKPDAVERNLIGEILSFYEKSGLKIVEMKMEKASREVAEGHYGEHKGKVFFEPTVEFIISSPLVALILEGEGAIEKIRKINGATDPAKAEEGTIRKLYATAMNRNCVHASDSVESANREIALWFPNK